MIRSGSKHIREILSTYLKSSKSGLLIFLGITVFGPFLLSIVIGFKLAEREILMDQLWKEILVVLAVFVLSVLLMCLILEVIFNLLHRIFYRRPYSPYARVKYKDIYVESHPYLPFIHKNFFKTEKKIQADYPLHQGKYFYGSYRTNNIGFVNGIKGDRNVSLSKNLDAIRINCVGASTTGNYIIYKDREYSYPMELESILSDRSNKTYEVNNCGQGGYNSADILVRFLLQSIETKPDIVVLYNGYNDISAYLTPDFKADYSHSRVNIADSLWKFRLLDNLPLFRFNFINYMIEAWLPVNIRNSLLDLVSKGKIDLEINPEQGLEIFKRNTQSFIDVCTRNNIRLIMSTFCFFLHKEVSDSKIHCKYEEIVKKENIITRELARLNNIELVDNAGIIPSKEDFFVDTIHFTPEGMKLLASNFADVI